MYNCQMQKQEVSNLWREAKENANLRNTLDITQILKNGTKTNDFLLNKSILEINQEIIDSLKEIPNIREDEIEEYRLKLKGYRLVDELTNLHKGKHTRWIPKYTDEPYLTNGGVLTNIKFGEDDIIILIKSYGGRFIQYKFNECIAFQKMSFEEELALSIG